MPHLRLSLLIPGLIILVWCLAALLADQYSASANRIALPMSLAGPHADAWLGHDDLGRPVLDRLISGARVSFTVALWVVTLSACIGTLIGMCAGWFGGKFDHLITRIIDVFMAFPGILLAIALAGVMGAGLSNVVIALTVVGWVGFARLARAQTLTIRQREHIQAAEALGTRLPSTLRKHVFPLILTPLIIEASFGVAGVVIAEAGLSFLGLGIQAPDASWGSMIRDGTRYMLVAPHLVLSPGITLCLVVLAVNLLGDSLRDYTDSRLRQARKG